MNFRFALFLSAFLFSSQISFAASDPSVVLMIGDSHAVGDFGQDLHKEITHLHKTRIASYASWGSSPNWWMDGTPTTYKFRAWDLAGNRQIIDGTHPTPLLKDLADEIHPDVIIVALGSNLLGSSQEWIDQSIEILMDEARADASRCIWIGPPSMRQNGLGKILTQEDYDAVDDALKRYASKDGCDLINSHVMTYYPPFGGDGIHYDFIPVIGPILAQWWSDEVFLRLLFKL
jgi:hypothetical protein